MAMIHILNNILYFHIIIYSLIVETDAWRLLFDATQEEEKNPSNVPTVFN